MKLGALGYQTASGRGQRAGWGPTIFASLLVFAGAVMFAAWIGGSLGQLMLSVDRAARHVVADLGFAVDALMVTGVEEGPRAEAVRRAAAVDLGSPIFTADPQGIRERVRAIEWVKEATVLRLWPDQVLVIVEPRGELARWREGGHETVVDAAGGRLYSLDPDAYGALPVVEGDGAGPAASVLFDALKTAPAIGSRLDVARFEGGRRWRLVLRNGAEIDLPAQDIPIALATIERLHARDGFLDAAPARYDLRDPNRLVASPLSGREGPA